MYGDKTMNPTSCMLYLAILSLGISCVLGFEPVTFLVSAMCFGFYLYMWETELMRRTGE